ncbi:MAG: lipid IV(A) 3-deoxy-D-manno-octulosonic acid transferase, partial [Candidatus Rokuibacteriota bacterium]
NFRDAAALLTEAGGGIVVVNADALTAQLTRLLQDDELRLRLGTQAYEAVASRQGAVQATLDLVAQFLRPRGTP